MKNYKNILALSGASLAFGLIGGLAALAIYQSNFSSGRWPFSGAVDVSSALGNSNVIIREPKNVIVQEDVKINETANSAEESLVGIFKKKDVNNGAAQTADLNKYYVLSDSQYQALAVTSDGWLIAKNFEPAEKNILDNYVIITADKKVHPIQKAVFDKTAGYTFLKIEANGLAVKSFSGLRDVYPGMKVLAVSFDKLVFPAFVTEVRTGGGVIKSSDYNPREIIIDSGIKDSFKGSFVFNMGGQVAGYINQDGKIEHANNFLPAVQSLLKIHGVKRASFGVDYVNFKDLAGTTTEKGALIVKGKDGTAVRKDSPAAKAGLAEGNIILEVNGQEVDKDSDLEAMLSLYNVGDKIKIKYSLKGQVKETEVTIGELK